MIPEIEIPQCAAEDADLIFRGEYDIPLSRPPATVLDFGGNVGLFSLWAAQRWPDAAISAHEPWPENAALFRKNLRAYSGRVTLHEDAVGKGGGLRHIRGGRNQMCCSFSAAEGEDRLVRTVAPERLGSAEFVKIDTEGAELEILEGLDLSQTRAIALEAHSQRDVRRITNLLVQRGYCVHDSHPTLNGCQLLKFVRRDEIGREPKLFVAVPTYGSAPQFWECLIKLARTPPCNLAIRHLHGDSLVSRARNTLTADFLETDCTDLLFVDSDLIFSSEHVARIMSHDVDLVAGFYAKKQEGPLRWVCNAKAECPKPGSDGLHDVRYMGTGFMRVRRRVFEEMIKALNCAYKADGDADSRIEHDLWPVGIYQFTDGSRRYLSEDWYFCQRWLDLGGQVYGDTRVILKHVGQAIYPLTTQVPEIAHPID